MSLLAGLEQLFPEDNRGSCLWYNCLSLEVLLCVPFTFEIKKTLTYPQYMYIMQPSMKGNLNSFYL